jgi:NAD(P)-dependent dehydrogenase (short-subunit alcohol dehydrogenase family)
MEDDMGMLDGKAVVITGSGRGIGAGCARGVARQGASVVVNDIDAGPANETVEAIRAAGGTAIACVADVTDWDDAGKLIQSCIDAFGKIDGLVNNAAVLDRFQIPEFNHKTAKWMVDVNVVGPLYTTGHAVKPMLAQGSGSIVNVVSGAHMGMPGLGVYGATKGAVASMIYTWALELAGTGVRVNGLSPFGATTIGQRHGDQPVDEEANRKRNAALQPPEANSPVVEYLLSDAAAHVNGQLVRIDRQEVSLYTHPALLVPPAVRLSWTAEEMANAFDNEFKDRLVGCGVLGMETLPIQLQSGYWKRAATAAS